LEVNIQDGRVLKPSDSFEAIAFRSRSDDFSDVKLPPLPDTML
jgi:hypothetical protein